jgi:hypothetical protein
LVIGNGHLQEDTMVIFRKLYWPSSGSYNDHLQESTMAVFRKIKWSFQEATMTIFRKLQ